MDSNIRLKDDDVDSDRVADVVDDVDVPSKRRITRIRRRRSNQLEK